MIVDITLVFDYQDVNNSHRCATRTTCLRLAHQSRDLFRESELLSVCVRVLSCSACNLEDFETE